MEEKKLTKKQILELLSKPRDTSISLTAEQYLAKKEQYVKNFWMWDTDEMSMLQAKLIDDDWNSLSSEEKEKYKKLTSVKDKKCSK